METQQRMLLDGNTTVKHVHCQCCTIEQLKIIFKPKQKKLIDNVLLTVCKQTYGLSIYMLPCAFPFDYLNQQLSSHDNGQFCIYFRQSSFLIHVKGEDSYK